MPNTADKLFTDALKVERQSYAVRITLIRVILVGLFLANTLYFHLVVRNSPWHTGATIFVIYFLLALLIWYLARSSEHISWYSGLAIPFLDVPMVVIVSLPVFASTGINMLLPDVVGLSAVFALLIAITTLTLQSWQILLTGISGVVAVALMSYVYDIDGQTTVFSILLVFSMAIVCLFLRRNLITLVSRASDKIYLQRHIDEIAALQRSMLPEHLPEIPGVEFAVSYLPSETAGGDYYGFRKLGSGRIGLIIADVSGHGPAAAMVMAMLRTALSAYRRVNRPVDNIVSDLNITMLDNLKDGTFVSAVFVGVDIKTGRFQVANAGHCHPLILRSNGKKEILELDGGPPLGVVADTQWKTTEYSLQPGDALILYTDGLSEAMSPDGTQFGVEGIRNSVGKIIGDADQILSNILESLHLHTRDQGRKDDQTVLVIRKQ